MTIARIIKDVLPDRTVASSTAFFALAAETSVETSAETSETRRALASLRTCSVRSLVQPSLAARLLIPVWLMLYWRPISTNESWPARYSRSTASQSINLASGGEQRPKRRKSRVVRLPRPRPSITQRFHTACKNFETGPQKPGKPPSRNISAHHFALESFTSPSCSIHVAL